MSRNTAMLLIIAGATCMSFVGLLMRLLETTDGMVILFYRSITLAGMVALVACLRRRQPLPAFLRSLVSGSLGAFASNSQGSRNRPVEFFWSSDGRFMVSRSTIDQSIVLRSVIANRSITEASLDAFLERVISIGKDIERGLPQQ